jgi:hypothetical protein
MDGVERADEVLTQADLEQIEIEDEGKNTN